MDVAVPTWTKAVPLRRAVYLDAMKGRKKGARGKRKKGKKAVPGEGAGGGELMVRGPFSTMLQRAGLGRTRVALSHLAYDQAETAKDARRHRIMNRREKKGAKK